MDRRGEITGMVLLCCWLKYLWMGSCGGVFLSHYYCDSRLLDGQHYWSGDVTLTKKIDGWTVVVVFSFWRCCDTWYRWVNGCGRICFVSVLIRWTVPDGLLLNLWRHIVYVFMRVTTRLWRWHYFSGFHYQSRMNLAVVGIDLSCECCYGWMILWRWMCFVMLWDKDFGWWTYLVVGVLCRHCYRWKNMWFLWCVVWSLTPETILRTVSCAPGTWDLMMTLYWTDLPHCCPHNRILVTRIIFFGTLIYLVRVIQFREECSVTIHYDIYEYSTYW